MGKVRSTFDRGLTRELQEKRGSISKPTRLFQIESNENTTISLHLTMQIIFAIAVNTTSFHLFYIIVVHVSVSLRTKSHEKRKTALRRLTAAVEINSV